MSNGDGQGFNLTFRQVMGIIAVVLGLIFVFQNNERVELHFILLKVTTSVWVGLLVSIGLGALLGFSLGHIRQRRKNAEDD